MSDAYQKAKGGRLTFKGGTLATRSKSIDKKTKKKQKKKTPEEGDGDFTDPAAVDAAVGDGGAEDIYSIDAAKRLKYDQLFPVEAKKFRYDPKSAASKSMEEALDDRVKKKADRYCK